MADFKDQSQLAPSPAGMFIQGVSGGFTAQQVAGIGIAADGSGNNITKVGANLPVVQGGLGAIAAQITNLVTGNVQGGVDSPGVAAGNAVASATSGDYSNLLVRGTAIILGFIFVAVGLVMFGRAPIVAAVKSVKG